MEVFYNGEWGTVCGQSVNKVIADALCAEVTGEHNSFALVYGTAGSSGLPYVKRTVFHIMNPGVVSYKHVSS